MKKNFPASVSYVLLVVVLTLLLLPLCFITGDKWDTEKLIGIIILIATSLFVLNSFLRTHYTIENTTLKVRCGLFYRKNFKINTIKSIKNTSSLLSSPAPSFDRIEICFNNGNPPLIISPKEKQVFANTLKNIHPEIENKVSILS